MFKTIGLLLIAAFLTISAAAIAQQQRKQVKLGQGAFQVAPDGECPPNTVRRIVGGQQQMAQQNYTLPVHLCIKQDMEPEASDQISKVDNFTYDLANDRSWPTFLPITQLAPDGTNKDFQPIGLTSGELSALESAIDEIEFPIYLLSGCNDRAHAAYMLLPPELKMKAFKVWIVAPSAYTRGVRGGIKVKSDDRIDWKFHIALAFSTDKGIAIFDPSLAPKNLISQTTWLNSFEYPPLSFMTITKAEAYLFYDEDNDVVALNNAKSYIQNKDIWVGNAYGYTGEARENDWIPIAIARDAVGVAVENDASCDAFKKYKGKPGELLEALKLGEVVGGCSNEFSIFQVTFETWKQKLN